MKFISATYHLSGFNQLVCWMEIGARNGWAITLPPQRWEEYIKIDLDLYAGDKKVDSASALFMAKYFIGYDTLEFEFSEFFEDYDLLNITKIVASATLYSSGAIIMDFFNGLLNR